MLLRRSIGLEIATQRPKNGTLRREASHEAAERIARVANQILRFRSTARKAPKSNGMARFPGCTAERAQPARGG